MVDADRKSTNKDTFATVDGQSMSEFQLTPKTDCFPGALWGNCERRRPPAREAREQERGAKSAPIRGRFEDCKMYEALVPMVGIPTAVTATVCEFHHVVLEHALLLRQLGPSGIIDPLLHHPNRRRDSHHKASANGTGRHRCLCQVRGCEPRWIRQGSPRPWNDRMGREGRPPQTWANNRRGKLRKYGHRPCDGVRCSGLPSRRGHVRILQHRKAQTDEISWSKGRPDKSR